MYRVASCNYLMVDFVRKVVKAFDTYDPRKITKDEWHGTEAQNDRLRRYLEDRRMTAPEVFSMSSRAPF